MPDANLLLYAYHPRAAQHEASRGWLEGALSGSELVRFPWLTLWAFLRISTNPVVRKPSFDAYWRSFTPLAALLLLDVGPATPASERLASDAKSSPDRLSIEG